MKFHLFYKFNQKVSYIDKLVKEIYLFLHFKGIEPLNSDAIASFDDKYLKFSNSMWVTTGSEVKTLHINLKAIGWQTNPPKRSVNIFLEII